MKRAPPPRGEAPCRSRSDGVDVELGAAAAQQRTAADQAGAGAEDQDDLATSEGELTTLSGLFSRSLQTREVVLEDAFDPRVVLAEDRVVVGVLQGGCDLRATEITAALEYADNNPILSQYYSGIKGVLEDYLASLQAPGEKPGQGGELAFTGGEIILILGAGAGLIGSGALL